MHIMTITQVPFFLTLFNIKKLLFPNKVSTFATLYKEFINILIL